MMQRSKHQPATALSDADRHNIAYWLGRLQGQACTPVGMPRALVTFVLTHKLAVFHEWPSGHWQVTESGWAFRNEVLGPAQAE